MCRIYAGLEASETTSPETCSGVGLQQIGTGVLNDI